MKRLVAEWKYFEKHGVSKEVISFSAIDKNSLEHFEAKIRGPTGTPYENGVFVLDVRITGAYPFSPPKMVFKTKIFHPNINSDGKICLDLLNDQWCVALPFEKVLLSICALVSVPNIDDFLVPEAAFLYREHRTEYNRKAREWTKIYALPVDVPAEKQDNITDTEKYNKLFVDFHLFFPGICTQISITPKW